MKRGLIIFAILILFANIVAADTVTLTDPEDVSGNQVTLECSGSVTAGVLTKAEFWTNITGTFTKYSQKAASGSSQTVTETITGLSNGVYEWNCVFYNDTVNDAYNFTASSNQTFTISVDSNHAPSFSGTIPDVSFAEDTTKSNAFDLDDYFSDEDGDTLTYSVSGNSSITVTISSGELSFSSTNNWTGYETLTFTASDGSLTNTSNSVIVNVTPVDDPPYLSDPFNNISWTMNTNKTVDLSGHFADVDTTSLGYTASSVSHITVYINDDEATLVPEKDWVGNTTIVFYANDTHNKTASNTITLNVKSNTTENHAPEILSYAPLSTTISMKDNEERTFEIVKDDEDGDTLTVKWQKDGSDISGATSDKYKLSKPAAGEFTLKVIVSDGKLTTSQSWKIKVRSSSETVEVAEAVTAPVKTENTSSIITKSEKKEDVCGDGIKGETENCANCIDDVPCGDNQVCIDAQCVEKASSKFAVGIILGIIVGIAGIAFLIYKINTHSQSINYHRGGIRPDEERPDLNKVEVRPVSDVDDFYHKHKKVKEIEAPERKETEIEAYIKKMRDLGKTEAEIKDKLLSKGWPKWQIEIMLKKIK
ncbi:hypothetical protein D6777_03525 [Candidatus Woesearchaeota archaeon]|nr:MAG: hypothetical protein D6777_03525 [Candidatus Woesearchaeota archaeon]